MITHACIKMTLHGQETTWRQVSVPMFLCLSDFATIVALCFGLPDGDNFSFTGKTPHRQYISEYRRDFSKQKNVFSAEDFSLEDLFAKSHHTAIYQYDLHQPIQIDLELDNSMPLLLPEPTFQLKQWSGDNPPGSAPWQAAAVADTLTQLQHQWFEETDEEDAEWNQTVDEFFDELVGSLVDMLMNDPSLELSKPEAYEKVNQLLERAGNAFSRNYSLEDCLSTLRKDEMLEVARANQFHGYSKLRRQELLEFLEQNLLNPDTVQRQLALLTQPEIDQLLDLCLTNMPFTGPETLLHASWAVRYGLCYIDPQDNVLTVPLELQSKIKEALKNTELTQQLHLTDTVYAYCYAAVYLFGAYPVEKLLSHLQPEVSVPLDADSLEDLVTNHVARSLEEFFFQDGYIVDFSFMGPNGADNLAALKKCQESIKMDYWPDKNTIFQLERDRWLIDKKLYHTFAEHCEPLLASPDYDIEQALRTIECCIRTGYTFPSITAFLSEQFFDLPDMKAVNRFTRDLQQIWNHTPMWLNGGISPAAKSPRKADNVVSLTVHSKKKAKKKSAKKKK